MKKYHLEIKLQAVNTYLEGAESIRKIAKKYKISKSMLHRWIVRYQIHGAAGLQESYTNYSVEFKMNVLTYMREMGASIEESTAIFNVSSSSAVQRWKDLFETHGIDALQPKKKERSMPMSKKSKKKPVEGSEEALRAEIEQLKMENEYLKKLQALIQEKKNLQIKTKRK